MTSDGVTNGDGGTPTAGRADEPIAGGAPTTGGATAGPPSAAPTVGLEPATTTSPQSSSTALVRGLHHCQLACPAGSEDVLRAFYVDVLAMTEVAKPAVLAARGGAWFRSGSAELHLGVEEPFHPALKAHPGLLVHDIDAAAARLEAAGAPVTWDPHFPGHRRLYTADPVGNRIELLEPISVGSAGD